MKLTAFGANNFRSLENPGLIPIHRITVLTGQNDGGKTSLLDALGRFLDRKAQPESTDYTFKLGDTGEQEETITLSGQFEVSADEKTALNNYAKFDSDKVSIARKYTKNGPGQYEYSCKVHPDPRLRRDLSTCKIDELISLANELHISLRDRRSKERILEAFTQWIPIQSLADGWAELPSEVIDRFPSIHVFESSKTLDPESEITTTMRASFLEKIKRDEFTGSIKSVVDRIEEEMIREVEDVLIPLIKSYAQGIQEAHVAPQFDFSSEICYTPRCEVDLITV